MLLTEVEIQEAIEQAKTAFPNFSDWEYNNEINGEYFGFSVWGKFVLEREDTGSRNFFITLDTYDEKWRGSLTIGLPVYLWSSADFGDAHLLDTDDCDSLEDAITALKAEMKQLFQAFSVV
ncbi:MAG: hypothetical protein F6K25_23705 [Okeania sp. SIO2G4]|uniref:hypothetical protein n=1 Tax=unclassified Okeania TaxID=2634635 RepID=UPI0013BD55AC|nr:MULTISPECIES: hypothetical protein [unclassified Okeania]NEP74744.1 hypothetical protein [Okeania sp. SIO2G5]NEP95769.1 hypothetical protein [Okeania sp. SIO2F5]NEQ93504.1 hypothetical protein [Okeania sp. SIO2G4]